MEEEVIVYYGIDLASGSDCTVYCKWDGKKVYVISEEEYHDFFNQERTAKALDIVDRDF